MTTGSETDVALAKQLIAGTKKHFATVSSLTFANATLTPVQVEAFLQTRIDLRTAVDDSKAATKAKIVAEAAVGFDSGARRYESRRQCPPAGTWRRDCASHRVSGVGDDNQGWGRAAGTCGAPLFRFETRRGERPRKEPRTTGQG